VVWAWTKLNDLCLRHEEGATYTDWMQAACKGHMAPATFKRDKVLLEADGWVVQ
jgi:hypothetical protein